jgi:hypothetical protein
MSGVSKNGLLVAGLAIGLAGGIALAIPVFYTAQTRDVVRIGDLHVTATEDRPHVIPPLLGPAALLIGVVLVGASFVVKA